jgi:hypothetical protein
VLLSFVAKGTFVKCMFSIGNMHELNLMEGARMTAMPGLTWGVKESLISYIEALDDGVADAVAPASRTDSVFHFPLSESSGDDCWQFSGSVKLRGHWGALDVELREPRIELTGGEGVLRVRERGGRDPEKTLPFADLRVSARGTSGDGLAYIDATTALTGHGRLMLGGQYAVGAPLSPLRITFVSAP